MRAELERRIEERLGRAEWWLDAGRLRYVDEALDGLEGALAALPKLEERRGRIAALLIYALTRALLAERISR